MHIHKRYVILLFAYGNFWSAVCVSLQAPFFPKEAERKGATPSEYGLVFGVYELGIVILSPLFSKLTNKARTETMISLGLLIVGSAVITFGFLDKATDGWQFVSLALIVRLVEAIGCILFNVFNFTAVAMLYPDSIASSFSILQTGYGVGMLAGPTIGALLYNFGGFTLPFVALGSFLLVGAALSFIILPSAINSSVESNDSSANSSTQKLIKKSLSQNNNNSTQNATTWQLISNVSCLLDLTAIIATFAFIGFNAAALEPHLRQFDLSVIVVGFMFIVDGGVFAASSPIVGKLCDCGFKPKLLILTGHALAILAISFIGPLPLSSLEPTLPLIITGLLILGLSVGLKFVPSFYNTLHEAIEQRKFVDDKQTYALVTSVVYACGSLGSFVGPTIGGYLYEYYGYRIGSCVFVLVELILLLSACLHYLLSNSSKNTKNVDDLQARCSKVEAKQSSKKTDNFYDDIEKSERYFLLSSSINSKHKDFYSSINTLNSFNTDQSIIYIQPKSCTILTIKDEATKNRNTDANHYNNK